MINRLRENTGVYSAALFDATGEIVAISNTLAPEEFRYLNEAREVMATGKGVEIIRSISGEDYFSMIRPLQVSWPAGGRDRDRAIHLFRQGRHRARPPLRLIATLLLFGASCWPWRR